MRGLAIALLISGTMAWAEEPERSELPLTVGSKVKVRTLQWDEPLIGLVAAADDEMLTLTQQDGGVVKIPRRSISSAEMKVGRRGHAREGLVIGAVAGLGVGFAIPVDPVLCKAPDAQCMCSRSDAVIVGIVGDAGLGALIGHLIKTDRWARLHVSGGLAVGRAGPGLRLTLRF